MNLKFMPLLVLLTALMSVIVACGEDSLTYRNEGDNLSSNGYYQEAIKQYDEAIRLDPDDADAYFNRAYAFDKLGQYERAIDDYDQAIRLDPDDADAYFNRAYAFDELGQYERAIDDYDQAIRLDPDDADAYFNRGLAYKNLGKYELAKADFGKACSMNNEHCSDIPFRFAPTLIPTSSPDPSRGVITEVITDLDILGEFESNAVVAIAKYTDQTFKVTGVIEEIDYDYYDNPYVQLSAGKYDFRAVRCMVIDDGQIRKIVAGDEITLEGTFAEWDSPTIYLVSCSVVSD